MSLLLCALFVFVNSYRFLAPNEDPTTDPQCYGAIFDAGSSGTRVYIYEWNCRLQQMLPAINITEQKNNKKVQPGLASFATNLDGIQNYLQPLIDFIYEIVPQTSYNYTPVMLGATAGMRVLPIESQNAIIQTVQGIFNNTKLLYNPDWVRVLTGQEEGMYMWMSVYYLLNETQNKLLTMDLGGASTQNAFAATGATNDFVILNSPPNITKYSLYAVSYLGYGNDMARDEIIRLSIKDDSTIISSPCYFDGYSMVWSTNTSYNVSGTGNLSECQSLIQKYLNTSAGTSINGSFEPIVTDQNIYGTNGIVTIASFFNLTQFTLPTYYSIMQDFTNLTWAEAQAKYNSTYLSTNYFMSVYAYELIKNGYNIPETSTIYSPELINGLTPSWTLAACAYQLGQIDCESDSPVCVYDTYGYLLFSFYMLLLALFN